MNSKYQTFVILTAGYWGKGRTITEAARNCRKQGGKGNVVCRMFPETTDKQHEKITVDNYGAINYPEGLECIRIVSPAEGHKVKLASLIP